MIDDVGFGPQTRQRMRGDRLGAIQNFNRVLAVEIEQAQTQPNCYMPSFGLPGEKYPVSSSQLHTLRHLGHVPDVWDTFARAEAYRNILSGSDRGFDTLEAMAGYAAFETDSLVRRLNERETALRVNYEAKVKELESRLAAAEAKTARPVEHAFAEEGRLFR